MPFPSFDGCIRDENFPQEKIWIWEAELWKSWCCLRANNLREKEKEVAISHRETMKGQSFPLYENFLLQGAEKVKNEMIMEKGESIKNVGGSLKRILKNIRNTFRNKGFFSLMWKVIFDRVKEEKIFKDEKNRKRFKGS